MRSTLVLVTLFAAGVAAAVQGQQRRFQEEVRTVVERAGTAAFSPDGQLIAVGHPDGATSVWETRSGEKVRTLNRPAPVIRSVAWSPEGRLLAAAGGASTVTVWDAQTWQRISTLKGHTQIVHAVAFSPDGSTLASGSSDRTVQLWDVRTGTATRTLDQPEWQPGERRAVGIPGAVFALAFSPDGKTLVSAGGDGAGGAGELVLWDVSSGQMRQRLLRSGEPQVWTVAYSSDGRRLISGAVDGTMLVFDAATGTVQRRLDAGDQLRSLALSPDGQTLAVGIRAEVQLRDLETGALTQTLRGHANWVGSLDFSPDGALLVSGGSSEIKLWSLKPAVRARSISYSAGSSASF